MTFYMCTMFYNSSAKLLDSSNNLKAFGRSKFSEGDTKVKLDVVDMFYAAKFHPADLCAAADGERIFFRAEVINELYGLSNEAEYLGHELINHLTEEEDSPHQHDSIVPFEYAIILHCIITKQVFDLDKVIQRALLTYMENHKCAKLFPSTVEKLCLKYVRPFLARLPQTHMPVGDVVRRQSTG
ncbi:hypothetical protein E5676_scaffold143G001680 [Cucumis melo var. makuwa]|uniref:Uncharacterized protein n=1 Tax=Cucumis melo var. makuwa TaxID=1194695 RepID=A0A5D3C198_CUCMM|nr:hypothetical protein E6C27_scaffold89G004130 [Cucumis melo var. makuwa]TYK04952.1 hypothetical protein E5676_scaffold143G001680 [Cucumis melo var. makuwa]